MSPAQAIPLTQFETVQRGVQALLDELESWLDTVYEGHLNQPWQGIHDEGTFVTAWAGYYALTNDDRVVTLANTLRDSWQAWSAENMVHGYHPKQEAHHGPEHYLIFLAWLAQLNPRDETTQRAILDAAHHIGNWVRDIPAWYSGDEKRFVSNYLGTAFVGDEGLNIIEHLRFVYLALQAFEISREIPYFNFALEYGGQWANAILNEAETPLYLDASQTAQTGYETILNTYLGAAPKDFGSLSRLENHVANGTPRLFIKLWLSTDDERFAQAAKKLIKPLLPELKDPYSNPTGSLFSLYRQVFANDIADAEILDTIGPAPLIETGQKLVIEAEADWDNLQGLGKRFDMPAWHLFEDGVTQGLNWPSPAALALAYEISGEEQYALTALGLALGKLKLARQVYQDGRHHGCTARSIAAICRGHGRCWGVGDVSGVLQNHAIVRAYGREPKLLRGLVTN